MLGTHLQGHAAGAQFHFKGLVAGHVQGAGEQFEMQVALGPAQCPGLFEHAAQQGLGPADVQMQVWSWRTEHSRHRQAFAGIATTDPAHGAEAGLAFIEVGHVFGRAAGVMQGE
ncbi:hypothetical protein D3C76_999390 [compost metagenome]